MSNEVKITVLAEERSGRTGLIPKHSWAVWIEIGSRHILFDVGQGEETVSNASKLGVDLKQCDTIILSHGHYDHSGHLEQIIKMLPDAPIFAHPKSTNKKYARNADGTSRYNGMPPNCIEALKKNSKRLTDTTTPTDLGSGIFLTGEVPRKRAFENSGGEYFRDPECSKPDPIEDDQALFFDSVHGTVVLLGCAHAGVINTIDYVRMLTGGKKIHAVLGGMHLIHASDERIKSTTEALEAVSPEILGISHCTGSNAAKKLKEVFGNKCIEQNAGARISFEAPGRG